MTEFSRVTYNYNDRLVFNDTTTDSTKYVLLGVPAITDSLVINSEDEKSDDVGIIDYGSSVGKGQLIFPVTLYASSINNMNSLIQTVKQALNPELLELDSTYGSSTDYVGYHPLEWTETVGSTSRDFRIYAKSQEVPQIATDSLAGCIRRSTVRLKVADTRKYLQDASSLTGAGTANNAGTFTTPVTITVTASGATSTSLVISNSTTGENINVTTALSAGQVLTINTGTHSVKLDGTEKRSMLGSGTTWWLLNPGNNTLAISNGTNATVSFSWYSAWPI